MCCHNRGLTMLCGEKIERQPRHDIQNSERRCRSATLQTTGRENGGCCSEQQDDRREQHDKNEQHGDIPERTAHVCTQRHHIHNIPEFFRCCNIVASGGAALQVPLPRHRSFHYHDTATSITTASQLPVPQLRSVSLPPGLQQGHSVRRQLDGECSGECSHIALPPEIAYGHVLL